MTTEERKKILSKILSAFLVIMIFLGGIFIGRQSNAGTQMTSGDLLSVSENKDLNQFWKVWKLLNDKYPFKDKIPSDDDRLYGAIGGMVDSFNDPYTMFFPPKEAKLFADEVKGEFSGVGMEVTQKDGLLTVISPLKGSPAEKAGILPGDILVKINGTTTENMNVDEAISQIRGKEGTTVKVTVARKDKNELIDITITRATIAVPIVDTKTTGDVFIISLYSFSENSSKLFTEALQKFTDSGLKKLVIDLRNNPGGYLDSAVDIGSYFIPQGKIIVRENQGNDSPELVYRSHGTDMSLPSGLKTIVLMNSGSASASEILAGALSEHGAADIVGSQSFGKGSVQELIPLSDGSSVKITVAKWLTPNGVSISEKGITPKYVVNEKPTEKNTDPVMQKALTLLNYKK
jgi:carboxyl-terminal processing protease